MSELCALLDRHCAPEFTTTAIPRLILSRADQPTKPHEAIYYPLLCVVAQGRKRVFVGDTTFDYDPSTYLIATVGLPAIGQVTKAPYLGLTYGLDLEVLASLQLVIPTHPRRRTATSNALAVNPLDADLLDPLLRLLRLLDRPEEIPIMGPLIEREIHYRLLLGPQREMLGQLATPTSHLTQIWPRFSFHSPTLQSAPSDRRTRPLGGHERADVPPPFPGGDDDESLAVPEADPVAGSTAFAPDPGCQSEQRGLPGGLRKFIPV